MEHGSQNTFRGWKPSLSGTTATLAPFGLDCAKATFRFRNGTATVSTHPHRPGQARRTMCKSVSAGKPNCVRGRSSIRDIGVRTRTNLLDSYGSRTKICPATRSSLARSSECLAARAPASSISELRDAARPPRMREREALRPEMEPCVVREVRREGTTQMPFLELVPDWFEFVPRENRWFQDWEESSASAERATRTERSTFTTTMTKARARSDSCRIHCICWKRGLPGRRVRPFLMDRVDAIDREVGVHSAGFF